MRLRPIRQWQYMSFGGVLISEVAMQDLVYGVLVLSSLKDNIFHELDIVMCDCEAVMTSQQIQCTG